jgi:hypothetical protein
VEGNSCARASAADSQVSATSAMVTAVDRRGELHVNLPGVLDGPLAMR